MTNDVDEWRARYEKVESEGKARTTKMKELETALAAAATAAGPSAEELDKITQSETGAHCLRAYARTNALSPLSRCLMMRRQEEAARAGCGESTA
eukprot:COSAG02_NODE_683_length_18518_cov_4.033172_4_plen_95_part_00